MSSVAHWIAVRHDNATMYSDDLLQCDHGYGGRVGRKEFGFVFFPSATERWEFRLLADEIDEIGSGQRDFVRVGVDRRVT